MRRQDYTAAQLAALSKLPKDIIEQRARRHLEYCEMQLAALPS
jgi:hypothetical protein